MQEQLPPRQSINGFIVKGFNQIELVMSVGLMSNAFLPPPRCRLRRTLAVVQSLYWEIMAARPAGGPVFSPGARDLQGGVQKSTPMLEEKAIAEIPAQGSWIQVALSLRFQNYKIYLDICRCTWHCDDSPGELE